MVMFRQSKSGSFTKHGNKFSGSAGDGLDQASARAIASIMRLWEWIREWW